MSDHSFSNGQSLTLPTARTVISPYDSNLRFNRIVDHDRKNNDPSKIVYSIAALDILKAVEADQLDQLFKITLAGRQMRSGISMWDTLFNNASRQSLTACIFTAQNDFSPIPQDRVPVVSKYLDFSMSVSRVHLSQVIPGDRVGIAVRDISKEVVYVLLYILEDVCSVTATQTDDDGRSSLIAAINAKMEHAIRIDESTGDMVVVDMEEGNEYNKELATPFVQGLYDTVYDIVKSYSWKPHLLPITPNAFKREELEARLIEQVAKIDELQVSYTEFEDACRAAYQRAKHRGVSGSSKDRRRPKARGESGNQPAPVKQTPPPPIVEIVSLDNKRFIAKLDGDSNPTGISYSFDVESMGNRVVTETFLLNKDLDRANIGESSKLLVLGDQFGPNAYLRYFSLNF